MTANRQDTSSQLDKKAAAQAYAKLARGEELSRQEQAVVKRFEKQREEELRWKYYESIPKKHWRQMSGRQVKVINEQAQRYGIPFGGPTVNLPEVVRALHDFLADQAHRLSRTGDPLMDSPHSSPALDRYREERALLAKYDRLERAGQLASVREVVEVMHTIGCVIRDTGLALEREFGPRAWQIFSEGLDDAEKIVNEKYGHPDEWAEGRRVIEDDGPPAFATM